MNYLHPYAQKHSNNTLHIIPCPLTPVPSCSIKGMTHRWLTPFGITQMNGFIKFFPPHLIARSHSFISKSITPSTLSNYASGLLILSKFCDNYNIPELFHMPTSKALLTMFITCHGMASISSLTLHHWLLGLELWHEINGILWHGHFTLRCAVKAAALLAPHTSRRKYDPMTIQYLECLHNNLDFEDPFDASVYSLTCLMFWSQAHLGELSYDNAFAIDTCQLGNLE